ncbi:MAG: hypothetical protein WA876_04385 [Candidatus Acidiferrales bacterium]
MNMLSALMAYPPPHRFLVRAGIVAIVYAATIFGGGYVIRALIRPLLGEASRTAGESAHALRNAGMYIGWLERFVILTALLLRSPATAGLVLTAKAIARYPEFKQVRFAEYFLIGTLLSISAALVGGAILFKVLYGTVALEQ